MNIRFDLDKFKSGQKALTRSGRVATFVGICDECRASNRLVAHLQGYDSVFTYFASGVYPDEDNRYSLYDLVSMVSRHQHLIDSYDPEDTWQFKNPLMHQFKTIEQGKSPNWDDACEYRLHPHNKLIKAYKKGAKIETREVDGMWYEVDTPSFYEDWEYRIKLEPESEYPIYKKANDDSGLIVKFLSLTQGEVVERGNTNYTVGEIHDYWRAHTKDSLWQDWTPPQETVPEPVIHCLCYNPGHVHGEFSWSPSIATKQLAVTNGWKIIQEWEV